MAKATPVDLESLAGSLQNLDDPDDGLAIDGEEVEAPEVLPSSEVELEDGSVEITLEDEVGPSLDDADFHVNLAEALDPNAIGSLTRWVLDLCEQDIENRANRDKQYEEGMQRAGLSDQTKGGADFDGATRVVHPMLAKACIEFQSRAVKELFPATGPVKTKIIGEQTEEKVEKAERKRDYLNWQCTTQIEEYRSELERLLSQVPLAGAQYKRWWWDTEQRRPRTETVYIDNVFLPYGHSDFYTTPRLLYRQYVLNEEFDNRVRTGLYRELNLGDASFLNLDESRTQAVVDKVEGVEQPTSTLEGDGVRVVYHVELQLQLDEDPAVDGRSAPYIMHIDKDSEMCLGLYRNWEPDDDRFRKVHWMTEWSFIPWRGGPALGFAAIIGSLSISATGALRALLDSAHINNFPGGLQLQGAQQSGQNVQVSAGQLSQIKAPSGDMSPDIRKLVMPFPFNGPSTVLMTLLEWLTAQAEGTVAVASEKIADAADMPMGTALALIEHGSANFSAIHSRLHTSMARDLAILHRLNAQNMSDEETVEDLGEMVVYREDFEGPVDVQPVSDPNIFSEAQRYAQMQAVQQLKADPTYAPLFKNEQLLGRTLRLLGIPDIDAIANLPKEPKRLGPVDENYAAAMQERPLKAYDEQDHLLHLKSHILFSTSPIAGANPLVAAGMLAGMLQHCKEHIMMLWREHNKAAREAVLAGYQMQGIPPPPEDEMVVQAAAFADKQLAADLGPMIMPGMEKMQEQLGQITQNSAPKADPNTTLQEQTKKEVAAIKAQQEQQSTALEDKLTQANLESTERLGKLAAAMELIQRQLDDNSKYTLQKLQGEQATQLAVVNAELQKGLQSMQSSMDQMATAQQQRFSQESTAQQQSFDMQSQIQQVVQQALQEAGSQSAVGEQISALQQNIMELIQGERQTNQQAMQQLAQELQGLRTQQQTGAMNEPKQGPPA